MIQARADGIDVRKVDMGHVGLPDTGLELEQRGGAGTAALPSAEDHDTVLDIGAQAGVQGRSEMLGHVGRTGIHRTCDADRGLPQHAAGLDQQEDVVDRAGHAESTIGKGDCRGKVGAGSPSIILAVGLLAYRQAIDLAGVQPRGVHRVVGRIVHPFDTG